MRTFYLTDAGKVRDHNEDSVTIVKNETGEVLLAVADGMGGHNSGEIASSIAIGHLGKRFSEISTIGQKNDAVAWLRENINELNNNIFKYTGTNPETTGMGTTLVVAILTNEFLLFANIGDSSGFVIKDGVLHKITHDHTLVNLLVETGELTEEEAKQHPRKNVLMRALGANNPAEVDIFYLDTDIEGIMLCSDGLTTMLNHSQIERVLISEGSITEKVAKLIKKANNRGGIDNISIAYLDLMGGDEE